MRRAEPLEPEVAAALAAIDATLAGDPVDPEHAELAELALILRDERPVPDVATVTALDERVAAAPQRAPSMRRWPRPRLAWVAAPVAALAAVGLVVVVVSGAGRGGSGSAFSESAVSSASSSAGSAASSAGGGATSSAAAAPSRSAAPDRGAASGSSGVAHGPAPSPSPSPSGPGKRQVIQSAQLSLSAPPRTLDDVAQQVFDVVDSEQGIVSSSHVTATGGPDGSARFELSVPVARLQRTVSELSRLRGAHVVSRTDDTTDITGQVGGAGRRLAEARALRRSLLRQLAAATTPEATASLKAQLHDADAAIARDSATLNGLHRQVDYSSLTVTIQASSGPVAPATHGHAFSLHSAVHDAGRVLVVAAGVALIALAVLVPLALLIALLAWLGLALRRRRRETMLDLI